MRKFFDRKIFPASLLIIGVLTMAFLSCVRDDDANNETTADYTVMLYGCSNDQRLDACFLRDLEEIEKYGCTDRVQFVAEYKFGSEYQEKDPDSYGGTRLYTLNQSGLLNECVAGQGFRMDDPDNMADFIKESMRKFPAKKYILILNGDGGPFSSKDTPTNTAYPESDCYDTRSLLSDDNTSETISICIVLKKVDRFWLMSC